MLECRSEHHHGASIGSSEVEVPSYRGIRIPSYYSAKSMIMKDDLVSSR
jgi:hypothetical protein